jgi:hypothetical protein
MSDRRQLGRIVARRDRVKGRGRERSTAENKPRFNLNQAITHLNVMTNNLLQSRAEVLKSLMDPEDRDIDEECGYKQNPTYRDFFAYYKRHGVAKKANDVWPDGTWATDPDLYENDDESITTPFEKAWNKLVVRLNIWHYLHRVDVLSGIGRFGILFLGFDDRRSLDRPVRREQGRQLLYIRAFDESLVSVKSWETDRKSPRYGQPLTYDIQFFEPEGDEGLATGDMEPEASSQEVHWTRVLHVADNRMSSEVFGKPRLEAIIDWLWDLRKVVGGAAEMFWKGAFPGFSVEALPGVADTAELDEESIKDQIEAYMKGLKRYLAVVGMTIKPLAPQVSDPTNHINAILTNIALALDVPYRVFTGSEAAHLASTQDLVSWNKRLAKRQKVYVNPMIIRPFVDRLMKVGVLPTVEDYKIDWTDLNNMSEKDRADVALKLTQSLMQYVTGGIEKIFPPKEYFVKILGLNTSQANQIVKLLKSAASNFTKEVWKKPEPAAGKFGAGSRSTKKSKDPSKKTGSARNSLGSSKT